MTTRLIAGFLLGVAILIGCFTCVREAESWQPVNRSIADVNVDGQVNVLDLLNVALCYGEVSEEPCLTSTSSPSPTASLTNTATATNSPSPTFTPSSTATAISTSTPTSTPTLSLPNTPTFTASPSSTPTPSVTPSAYGVSELIADSTGAHEGCIPPPASGFDWGQHGRYGDQTRDAGDDQLTGWGVVEWRCDITPYSGAFYEVRNVRVLAWNGSTWIPNVATGLGWCVKSNVASSAEYVGIPCPNGLFQMPTNNCNGQCAIHWATQRVSIPSGTICMATFAEARGTSGLLANLGSDWIDNGNVAGDHLVGAFQALHPTNWKAWGASGCATSILTAHPPFEAAGMP